MKKILLCILTSSLLSGCDFLEIDKCLDRGGKWDYEENKCEYKK